VASDELDGVVHESAHLPVAGVVPQYGNGDDGGPARRAVPTELYLVRYQYAGETDEWLYLGDGHHGLDVSPETVQRLRRAIGQLMDDGQGVGKVGSGAWLGDELDGSFWAS